jgi:hypothetical protein
MTIVPLLFLSVQQFPYGLNGEIVNSIKFSGKKQRRFPPFGHHIA